MPKPLCYFNILNTFYQGPCTTDNDLEEKCNVCWTQLTDKFVKFKHNGRYNDVFLSLKFKVSCFDACLKK